jgi:hypothetical protein
MLSQLKEKQEALAPALITAKIQIPVSPQHASPPRSFDIKLIVSLCNSLSLLFISGNLVLYTAITNLRDDEWRIFKAILPLFTLSVHTHLFGNGTAR